MKNKGLSWAYFVFVHIMIALHTNFDSNLYIQIKYKNPELIFNKLLVIVCISSYLLLVFSYVYPLFKIKILAILRIGKRSFFYMLCIKAITCNLMYLLVSSLMDYLIIGQIEFRFLLFETLFSMFVLSLLWKISERRDIDILIAIICIFIFRLFIDTDLMLIFK